MRLLLLALILGGCVRYRATWLAAEPDPQASAVASVYGKYEGLLLTFEAPEDVERYGPWCDWGYWAGRRYKGVGALPTGYWVYVEPTWYVWERQGVGP